MDKLQEIELRSESVQEILGEPPHWIIHNGISLLLAVMALCFGVSWFVKYPDYVASEIIISTQNPPENVTARTQGKIVALLIDNQQEVTANTLLAVIESSANYQDILLLKNTLDTLQYSATSLYFPMDRFADMQLGEVQAFYNEFQKNYLQYQLQVKLQPYTIETIAGKQSLQQEQTQIQSLLSQKKLEQAKYNLALQDFNRNQNLHNQGVISAVELEQKKIVLLQAQQAIQSIDISLSQMQNQVSGTQKTLKGVSISQQKDEVNDINTTIQSLLQLKKALKEWQQNYLLYASINGKVNYQSIWGTNQMAKAGEVVFTIFPKEGKSLYGKIKLPALNSGKVKQNQKVIIKLNNYPFQQFGNLQGTLKNISATSDEKGNYIAEVQLPNSLITTYHKSIKLDKELSGTAEIVTEDLRLIERFFYSFRELLQKK